MQVTAELTQEAQARWGAISDQVEEVWAGVIQVADHVVQAHAKFGFAHFADKIHPSLEDILLSLQVVESILDTVSATGNLDYSETRKVGNAKQQILWIQAIGNALKYGNETDYLDAIRKLGAQPKI
jgi:hypothetical protein